MAWSTTPQGLLLAAGQANQFTFSFGDIWKGPQLATAKLDASQGGGGTKVLVTQWQGTANEPVFGRNHRWFSLLASEGQVLHNLSLSGPSGDEMFESLDQCVVRVDAGVPTLVRRADA